jgi:hypothetical protein
MDYAHQDITLSISWTDIKSANRARLKGHEWPKLLCMSCPFAFSIRRNLNVDEVSVFLDIITAIEVDNQDNLVAVVYDIGPASVEMIKKWDATGKAKPQTVTIKKRVRKTTTQHDMF